MFYLLAIVSIGSLVLWLGLYLAWCWLLSASEETSRERHRLTDGCILREIERL